MLVKCFGSFEASAALSMSVGRFLGGAREENTFLGTREEPPLVARLPLPTAEEPLPTERPRVLDAAVADEIVFGSGLGEALLVLVKCLDIAVSVDSLRCSDCRSCSATSANGSSKDDED
jgi:hypothetical protein